MFRTLTRFGAAAAATMVLAGTALAVTSPASAAPAPLLPPTTDMLSADALPTVQIDGVAWSQVVIGNTVYVGGRFNNARPAGAAAGTSLTPRSNLLAYNITTGNLITTFNASVNGQVLSVTKSPDGSRIYAVGDFTTAGNGVARRRVAAFNATTGALITTFNPVGVNSQARAVIATNDTVYVGGGFLGAGNTLRNNLAAFRASDGALVNWNPSADYTVWTLAISTDGSSVFAGGSFQNVGGQPAYGLAKIDATTGALMPWNATNTVRNGGVDAGITSLNVQGSSVYGTTWHFGAGGNLEGTFKAAVDSGDVEWVTDCHGDVYSSYLQNGVVYTAGHAHYCGNMGGGHPQYPTWRFQNAQGWTEAPAGEILNETQGYYNWHGLAQGPSMVNWLPTLQQGTFTGQGQAAWSVAGNSDYVAYGGEFPRVNNANQQGLVRFARRSIAPRLQGPAFTNNQITPTLTPTSTSSLRVSWMAGFDRDDLSLRYEVFRTGTTVARYTTTANSNWWTIPALGFVETGLTPGATYTYRIVVRDSDNNVVNGASRSVTMPTSPPAGVPTNAYANQVRADGAKDYWPLNETAGPVVYDRAGFNDGQADGNVVWNQTGAVTGDSAATLTDNDSSRIAATGAETAPDTFTIQAWVRTNTTRGGRILGFSDLPSGWSGHRDRQIYMDNGGRILFGVRAPDNSARTVSSGRTYNDGQWHQITASMSADGMQLFVDGVQVARRTDTTVGEPYVGYWRIGGDNLDGWTNRPDTHNFIGDVDEVAIYPTALTQDAIIHQFELTGRTSPIPVVPADAYGAAVYQAQPDLYWRFGDASSPNALDSGRSLNDGVYYNGAAPGQAGVIGANTAASFAGDDDFVSSNASFSNPMNYTLESWFKTTTTVGGKIIGFGCNQTGTSGCYDRHVYMQDNGQLVFGVWTGFANTITTPFAYNDGGWHHVVAEQSSTQGMKLFVDGELIGTNGQTSAQDYSGYWKVGGDNTWGSSSAYFAGTIDEVAIYPTQLSLAEVRNHYVLGGGVLNEPPVPNFTSVIEQRRVTFDASTTTDADGSVAGYSWDFGDGQSGTGANPVHVFAPGTHTVTLTAMDNKGATASIAHQVTVESAPGVTDAYGAAVVADSPELYLRLGETTGEVADDSSGALNPGTYYNGYTHGASGAIDNPNKAVTFNGNDGFVSSDRAYANPGVFSEEAWFKTTSNRGGKIIGFGNNRTGSSNNYDRHVYMEDDGQLVFGTYTGQTNTITSADSYNNGAWHHVVATQSGSGMKLYVDGLLVGTHSQTAAEPYTGYWKIGGDVTWGSSSNYFDGSIDEVAVYLSELSPARVAAHYAAAFPVANQLPHVSFTSSTSSLTASFDGTDSTDIDGAIVSYAWAFGDGNVDTESGATASHTYDAEGAYQVTLTVTDDDGDEATAINGVEVELPNVAPTAAFTSSTDFLSADFDASGSVDSDGDIASYEWNFGDDSSDTGVAAGHEYAAEGTYEVTLTVTDDEGAEHSVTHEVSVVAPNVAPTASFSSTTDALTANFNPAESVDTDGTIASYLWTFGDGNESTEQAPTHTYTDEGTYNVTLVVIDNEGAEGTVMNPVTVALANQSPTALFTAPTDFLTAHFDGTGSVDPDGSIATYGWNFGDGNTGSGATPDHTYGAEGSYDVTLTVTDNDGAQASMTLLVSVIAPNQPPTAAFTWTANTLTLSVDGSTSVDLDGSIVGYAWTFGDTSTGEGITTTHPYATGGTYPVTLTVTDNEGATKSVTQSVAVSAAPPVLARDTFSRNFTNGFGAADVGGTWTVVGATRLAVNNGTGSMTLAPSSGPSAYLNGVVARDVDAVTQFVADKAGSGGGFYTSLVVRRIGTSDYRVKLQITATGVTAYLVRTLNGTETILATQTMPGFVYQPGQVVHVRLRATGTGTTTLQGKVWVDAQAEPAAWGLNATDTTAALQNPGAVGLYTYLSGTATVQPVIVRFDDFIVSAAAP